MPSKENEKIMSKWLRYNLKFLLCYIVCVDNTASSLGVAFFMIEWFIFKLINKQKRYNSFENVQVQGMNWK